MKIITIQAVHAKNRILHAYLKSKNYNNESNLFFVEKDDYSDIIMLSHRGHLFKFHKDNEEYYSERFEDAALLKRMLAIADQVVTIRKYPLYEKTVSIIKKSLGLSPNLGLF